MRPNLPSSKKEREKLFAEELNKKFGLVIPYSELVKLKDEYGLNDPPKAYGRAETRLLSIGGKSVDLKHNAMHSLHYFPRWFDRMVANGKVFDKRGLKFSEYPECGIDGQLTIPSLMSYHYLYAGFGLDDDDVWRPHIWLMHEGKIVELTRTKRKKYFGYLIRKKWDWIRSLTYSFEE